MPTLLRILKILSFLLPILTFAPFVRAMPRFRVDTNNVVGPVRTDVFGANVEYIGDDSPAVRSVMDGTPLARFPGGDDVSRFLWTNPTTGTCSRPQWNWDAIANYAASHGMALFLESNVVLGDAESTAQWVRDARARGIAVPYLDVGNEVWGSWDAGYRTPAQYEQDVRATAAAVRAVSPETKIVLEIGTFNQDAWNREAIRRTADVIDAIDYHYYPNHQASPDAMQVVAGADGVAPLMTRLRSLLQSAAPTRAGAIEILIGEYDGASDPPRGSSPAPGHAYLQWSMPNALFYGVALGEMLHAGVAAATFYELQGYRFGAVNGNACTDANTTIRRPKELALRLYREHFGAQLLDVDAAEVPTFHSDGPTNWDGFAGDAPFVRAYASLGADRNTLHLMITNRSAETSYATQWSLAGFEPESDAEIWQLAGDSIMATNENVGGPVDAVRTVASHAAIAGSEFTFDAPPHSVTALVLRRRQPVSSPADAGTTADAGSTDASDAGNTPAHDAGATRDAGSADASGEGDAPSEKPIDEPSGMSCTASPRGQAGDLVAPFALLALAAFVARRMRLRRCTQANSRLNA